MATKSFSTTLKFNRKSTDSLLNALGNTRKPKMEEIPKTRVVKDDQDIVNLFKKPATRKDI
ncbi:hypothetical protein O3801_06065 [Gemella sp. 27098_8_149]|jgi:hypothetical protein|uniref:hypothetical protein n=1 Tax=Gemella sp. 27098_8_149 TaxID=3003689 RepID=UPI00352D6E28